MKMNHVISVCVLAFFGASLSNTSIAETGLSSGEIKKVRYLSRALLQSRALEKKRMELEIEPERANIKKMEEVMEQLIAAELSDMMHVRIEEKNNVNSAVSVFNPNGSVTPETSESQSVAGLAQDKHVSGRVDRINKSKNAIASMRLATEEKLPSKIAFWKSKTKQDIRNQHVVDVARSVEQALTAISQKNHTDINHLRALKDRLTLKKADIKFDDIAPTIQTRTRHRSQ